MSKYKWPLGVKVFCFYVLLVKNFGFHWKNLMVQQNWIPTVQGIAMRKKLVSELPKFLDWLLYLAESSAGFLKLRSSCPNKVFGEKYSFRKNLLFFIVFGFWVKTFATWQVESGWVIKTVFFLTCCKSRIKSQFLNWHLLDQFCTSCRKLPTVFSKVIST